MTKIVGTRRLGLEAGTKHKKGNQGRKQANMAPTIDASGRSMHSITTVNRQYWFKLIKLYEIVGNLDALHGIWCQLAQQDGVMFRSADDEQGEGHPAGGEDAADSQEQNIDPNAES